MKENSFTLPEQEEALLAGCLASQPSAQKALYDRYKDAMYSLAYRITGNPDLAADVLQEAFIGVFRGLKNFKKRSTLGAWIRSIVVRTAYKVLRNEKPMQPLENMTADLVVDWGNYLDAEYLEQAIQDLPDGYRTVFILIEIEGYAHKEVAEMMGISPGTSKSQLFYAKRRLRKRLTQMSIVS